MDKKTEILKEMINESNSIVFFGGAGVSTESGIKDFRSVDGLYNQKYEYPPETILSHSFFIHNTMRFLPLDKINNYILDADTLSLEDEGLLYFTMNLEKEKYIHQKWSLGNLYLYSIDNKTIEKQKQYVNLTHLINKGKYLYIMDLTGNDNGYYLSINTNHYLQTLKMRIVLVSFPRPLKA